MEIERRSEKFAAWVRRANGCHVIERSQRNPIMQGQEQDVKTLKRKQCAHRDWIHEDRDYRAPSTF